MSAASRVFLLLIVLFLAFWAYQFREREIQVLLSAFREPPGSGNRPSPAETSGDGPAGINGPFAGASPVERVIDPLETRMRAVWSAPDPPAPREPEPVPEPVQQPEQDLAGGPPVEPAEIEMIPGPAKPARPAGDVAVHKDPPPPAPGNETPFAPGPAPPEGSGSGEVEFTYQVQERDTLWKIARRFLGSGLRYKEIQGWNPGKVAADGTVEAGARLVIRGIQPPAPVPPPSRPDPSSPSPSPPPPEAVKRGARGKSSGNGEVPETRTARSPRTRESREPAPRQITHEVKGKETLAGLARRYYRGDGELWTRIYEANRDVLEDPDALRVGVVLKIPDPAGPGRGSFR